MKSNHKHNQPQLDPEEHQRVIAKLMHEDAKLPKDFNYLANEVSRDTIKSILLIGATGIVGPHLLAHVLTQSNAEVYCLVRPHPDSDSKERILQELAKYQLDLSAHIKRIHIISGNIAKPQFALSDKQYESLAKTIDMIFHNAAWSNHLRSYAWPHNEEKSDLRDTNILSLKQALSFASAHKSKYINFTSTLAAINRCDLAGNLVEELPSLNNAADGLSIGYAQTKFIAEQLLQQAIVKGMPCRIIRLGQITGDSKTGIQFADNDHMMLEIKACIDMGFAPEWHDSRNFMPVDFAGRRIAELGLTANIMNGAYNLMNPSSIAWLDIIKVLQQRGYTINIISEAGWVGKLAKANSNNPLYRFKSAYIEKGSIEKSMPAMGKVFRAEVKFGKAMQALAGTLTRMPSSHTLLEKYLDYFIETGFFKPPH